MRKDECKNDTNSSMYLNYLPKISFSKDVNKPIVVAIFPEKGKFLTARFSTDPSLQTTPFQLHCSFCKDSGGEYSLSNS